MIKIMFFRPLKDYKQALSAIGRCRDLRPWFSW